MKNRNWFWGIFFLLSAAFVILSQTWFFHEISVMSIVATVFLAAVIISSLLKLHYTGIFIPLALLYMIYSKPFNLMYISPWLLILSAILISLSFSLLFPRRYKKTEFLADISAKINPAIEHMDKNNPCAKVTLSSTSKYIHSHCLQGGYFTSYLGVLDVYFDQAELSAEGADLLIDCVLGSINLYIPKHWNVVNNTNSYLGHVDYKLEQSAHEKDGPLLTLVGNVTLGDVEIFYI